jgi:hypothetical protein
MNDPICAKLRAAARMLQDDLLEVGRMLPIDFRNRQLQVVDHITNLVEAYEKRISELLAPQELPPIDTKQGGYSN